MCLKAGSTTDPLKRLVQDWSEEDVSAWLRAQGLEDLVGIFQTNNIDGRELLHLTRESLASDLKIGKKGGSQGLCVLREFPAAVGFGSFQFPPNLPAQRWARLVSLRRAHLPTQREGSASSSNQPT